MPDRLAILRDGLSKADRLIEIGPSYNPVAPKREGWQAFSIDHASQADLVAKYRADPSVDTEVIEPVDFVWTTGSLSDAVPAAQHGSFDVFVASHVIEHMPDLVGFFRSAERLTRDGARMVLAVPDKRVCFDIFRPVSTTGEALAAHYEQRSRHTRQTLFDYAAYQSTRNGAPGWSRVSQDESRFVYNVEFAHELSQRAGGSGYTDAHAWVFVPSSLTLIVLELARLGLADWQVERLATAEETEFYLWLRRGGRARAAAMPDADFTAERLTLLESIALETAEPALELARRRSSIDRTQVRMGESPTVTKGRAFRGLRSALLSFGGRKRHSA